MAEASELNFPALERSLRSPSAAVQAEAIVALPSALDRVQDDVVLNNVLLRLVDHFASSTCPGPARISTLWVLNSLGRTRLASLTNSPMYVSRGMLLHSSTDVATRVMALRLLGALAPLVHAHLQVHHKVLESLCNTNEEEQSAASEAALALAAISAEFAAAALPTALDIAGAMATSKGARVRCLRLLSTMAHTSELAHSAQDGGEALLLGTTSIGTPLSVVVDVTLKSLTILAIKSITTCGRQVALLLAQLPFHPATVLPCLHRLAPSLRLAGIEALSTTANAVITFIQMEEELGLKEGGDGGTASILLRQSVCVLQRLARNELLILSPALLGGKEPLAGTAAISLTQLEELCYHADRKVALSAADIALHCACVELECSPNGMDEQRRAGVAATLMNVVVCATESAALHFETLPRLRSVGEAAVVGVLPRLLAATGSQRGAELAEAALQSLGAALLGLAESSSAVRGEGVDVLAMEVDGSEGSVSPALCDLICRCCISATICISPASRSEVGAVVKGLMAELLASGHAATAARLLPALLWCLDGDGAVQSAHGTVTTCLRELCQPLLKANMKWEAYQVARVAMCEGLFQAPAWLFPALRDAAALPPQFDSWLHALAVIADAEESWGAAVATAGPAEVLLADTARASKLSASAFSAMSSLRQASSHLASAACGGDAFRFPRHYLLLRQRALDAAAQALSGLPDLFPLAGDYPSEEATGALAAQLQQLAASLAHLSSDFRTLRQGCFGADVGTTLLLCCQSTVCAALSAACAAAESPAAPSTCPTTNHNHAAASSLTEEVARLGACRAASEAGRTRGCGRAGFVALSRFSERASALGEEVLRRMEASPRTSPPLAEQCEWLRRHLAQELFVCRPPTPSFFFSPSPIAKIKVDPMKEAYSEVTIGSGLNIPLSGALTAAATSSSSPALALLLLPELCPTSAAEAEDTRKELWPPRPLQEAAGGVYAQAGVEVALQPGGAFRTSAALLIHSSFDPGLYRLKLSVGLRDAAGEEWVLPTVHVGLTVKVQR